MEYTSARLLDMLMIAIVRRDSSSYVLKSLSPNSPLEGYFRRKFGRYFTLVNKLYSELLERLI